MSDDNYYIVRGAAMRCDKGTHQRKINLKTSHGAYVNGKPKMNANDCVPEKNISYFGICQGSCPEGEGDIYLVGEDGETKTGKKCCYTSLDRWQEVKEDTLVEGEPALTTDSYLVCMYEGAITFVTTGQEDE